MVPTQQPDGHLTDRMKLMLIRSLAGASEGHEERALDLIARTLEGWSMEEMMARSVARYGF